MTKDYLFSIVLGFAVTWILDQTRYNSVKYYQWWIINLSFSTIGNLLYQSL